MRERRQELNGKLKILTRAGHCEVAGSGGVAESGHNGEGRGAETGCFTANVLPLAEGLWGERTDQAKRLKELEKENSRLRKLLAEQPLDISILREASALPAKKL
jgi:hypothetical protein